jgi:hypothetical protein
MKYVILKFDEEVYKIQTLPIVRMTLSSKRKSRSLSTTASPLYSFRITYLIS